MSIRDVTRNLSVTFYTNERVTIPDHVYPIKPEKLSQVLTTRLIRPNKSGPAFAQHKLRKGGTRKNVDVIIRSGIECDIDNSVTLNDLRIAIDPYMWDAYSTFSHNPGNGKIKFRLVIPFSRDVTPDEWPNVWYGCNDLLGNVLDSSTKDISRLVYLPSCPKENEQHAFDEHHDGELIDPDLLITLAQRKESAKNHSALNNVLAIKLPPPPETLEEIERIKSMLGCISSNCDYEKWRNIGWAIRSLNWTSGFNLFDEWSKRCKERYDAAATLKVWSSYNPVGGIGTGTLKYHAEEAGWVDPITRNSTIVQPEVAELNKQYAWDLSEMNLYNNDTGRYVDRGRFATQYGNRFIKLNNKSQPLGKAWLQHINRRDTPRVLMAPGQPPILPDGSINSWRGFTCLPQQGDISKFMQLLDHLITDINDRDYILIWLARLTQNPAERFHVALVVWSRQQGTGKSLLFETVGALLNERHFTVVGQEVFNDGFTDWQAHKVFVICDEVSSADKRPVSDRIKGWITTSKNKINVKNEPKFDQPNVIKYVFLSNHPDAVFMNETDRRFFVVEATSKLLPELQAKEFVTWRDTGGLSSLLEFLVQVDTSKFNPKVPAPINASKREMIEDNLSDLERWLKEIIDSSNLTSLLGREICTANELCSRYKHEKREVSSKAMTGALRKFGIHRLDKQARRLNGTRPRCYALDNHQIYESMTDIQLGAEMDTKQFNIV